jgi:hypothetical protein
MFAKITTKFNLKLFHGDTQGIHKEAQRFYKFFFVSRRFGIAKT